MVGHKVKGIPFSQTLKVSWRWDPGLPSRMRGKIKASSLVALAAAGLL